MAAQTIFYTFIIHSKQYMKILTTYTFLLAFIVFSFAACKSSEKKKEETPIAQPETPVVPPTPVKAADTVTTPAGLTTNSLTGTWNLTEKISHQQLKSFLGEEIAEAEYAEMVLTGTQSFFGTGMYDSKGQLTIRIKNNQSGEAVRLFFNYQESGTWRIDGDIISGTVTGGNYTPADDATRQAAAASPELTTVLTPVKGETTQLLVVSVKQNEIILKDKTSGWQSTLTR
jgi:Lipocalin-like domain